MSGATHWLQGPLGLSVAMRDEERQIYVHDLRRRIRWLRYADEPPSVVGQGIGASNIGISEDVYGSSCQLTLFGGPVFVEIWHWIHCSQRLMDR